MSSKPAKGTTEHRDWLLGWIRDCASELGVELTKLKRDAFLRWCMGSGQPVEERPTQSDVEARGYADGVKWRTILEYAADRLGAYPEPSRCDLGAAREMERAVTHRRKLERLIGDEEYYVERLRSALRDAIEANPPTISKLYKPKLDMDKPERREIVVHISDLHIGHLVDKREVPAGSYNYQIAARRMAYLCNQVADYDHGPDTALRVVWEGDIITGSIHSDDRGIDMLSAQCDAARQILTSMLDFWRHHFTKIYVQCSTGNHDRYSHRDHGKRPTAQKYDSNSTLIYRGVEQVFRGAPDVRFDIPLTPWSTWNSCGFTYLSTHGDGVFKVASPWKAVDNEKLFSQLWKLQANTNIDKIDVVMIGHHHWPSKFRIPGKRPNGHVMINGAACGSSGFPQTENMAPVDPVQCFWECTDRFSVGNYREADLWVADDDPRFDSIVPTPVPIGTELPKIAA